MQARAFLLGTLLSTFAAQSAFSATWKIDPSHSQANFKIKHMMVSWVHGSITGLSGSVDIDDKDVTKSKVVATLDPATIDTRDVKRDEHLKSPDFFDVKKNPSIKFESKTVSGSGENLKVVGALTLNGVTKDVELAVEGPTPAVKSPFGDQRRGLVATTKINRKDFNLVWNKSLDNGGVVIGEEAVITLNIELTDSPKAAH
jgi:polyisoprenoid-binding protein YceI